MLANKHPGKLRFPIFKYLYHLLFESNKIWNPYQFWHNYKVQYLKKCWNNDEIKILERCWKKQLRPHI
jgi:hypothetical protein